MPARLGPARPRAVRGLRGAGRVRAHARRGAALEPRGEPCRMSCAEDAVALMRERLQRQALPRLPSAFRPPDGGARSRRRSGRAPPGRSRWRRPTSGSPRSARSASPSRTPPRPAAIAVIAAPRASAVAEPRQQAGRVAGDERLRARVGRHRERARRRRRGGPGERRGRAARRRRAPRSGRRASSSAAITPASGCCGSAGSCEHAAAERGQRGAGLGDDDRLAVRPSSPPRSRRRSSACRRARALPSALPSGGSPRPRGSCRAAAANPGSSVRGLHGRSLAAMRR